MFVRINERASAKKYYLQYMYYEKLRLSFLFGSEDFKSVGICTNPGTKNAFLTATQFGLT